MRFAQLLGAGSVLLALSATSVMADGHGHGHGKHRNNHHGGNSHAVAHCPPGLAKKSPACVPPGQVRHRDVTRYGNAVGEVLRIGDYRVIRDLDRYGLQARDDWRYYSDGDRAYRVDSSTNKVLAVLNLIQAFSN